MKYFIGLLLFFHGALAQAETAIFSPAEISGYCHPFDEQYWDCVYHELLLDPVELALKENPDAPEQAEAEWRFINGELGFLVQISRYTQDGNRHYYLVIYAGPKELLGVDLSAMYSAYLNFPAAYPVTSLKVLTPMTPKNPRLRSRYGFSVSNLYFL